MIGFFTNDDGDRYFFLTNLAHGLAASAATESLSFTVTFTGAVTQLQRLSRVTGLQEVVPLTGNQLQITLHGGTGDLFKYDASPFPGLCRRFGPCLSGNAHAVPSMRLPSRKGDGMYNVLQDRGMQSPARGVFPSPDPSDRSEGTLEFCGLEHLPWV